MITFKAYRKASLISAFASIILLMITLAGYAIHFVWFNKPRSAMIIEESFAALPKENKLPLPPQLDVPQSVQAGELKKDVEPPEDNGYRDKRDECERAGMRRVDFRYHRQIRWRCVRKRR